MGILFSYAIFFGLFLMPEVPLGDDGFVIFTTTVLIGHSVLNWMIPSILIVWRSYTRWYNPILYGIVVTAGNCLGLFLASFGTDVSGLYESVFALNLMNLFYWSSSLIISVIFNYYMISACPTAFTVNSRTVT